MQQVKSLEGSQTKGLGLEHHDLDSLYGEILPAMLGPFKRWQQKGEDHSNSTEV